MRARAYLGLMAIAWLSAVPGCGSDVGPALDRGTVYLSITETIDDQPTDLNISELLIGRRLLHHGFRLVDDPGDARYRIEGQLQCFYYQDHKFTYETVEQHLEHQFWAEADLLITDSQQRDEQGKPRTQRLQLPPPEAEEPLIYGRMKMEDARRDIRRLPATLLSRRITSSPLLADPGAQGLLAALHDPFEQRTFNQLVVAMREKGVAMVPYLLQALEDDRPVQVAGEYPGLGDDNRQQLRVYHVADLALSDILHRFSGLQLTDGEDMLYRVQAGWVWLWEDLQKIPARYRQRPGEREDAEQAVLPADRTGEEIRLTPEQQAPIEVPASIAVPGDALDHDHAPDNEPHAGDGTGEGH